MSKPKAQARSALKLDVLADAARKQKIETLGDPLQVIARNINFDHLTQVIDELLPQRRRPPGRAPRIPLGGHGAHLDLYNLSDEQMEYQLLDRMS